MPRIMLNAFKVCILLLISSSLLHASDEGRHKRSGISRFAGKGQSKLCLAALLNSGPADAAQMRPSRKENHALFLKELQYRISQNAAATVPTEIPYNHFLSAVVEAVRIRYPDHIQKEGPVKRWADMENLVGFLNFNGSFETVYGSHWIAGKEPTLDLASSYQIQNMQIDHGRDPIRNGFIITLVESNGRYAFQFQDAYDEVLTVRNVSHYLAMYDAFLSHGLPISITPEVVEMVNTIPQ